MEFIRVTFNDDTSQVFEIGMRDFYAWELATGKSPNDLQGDKFQFSNWLWLAHHVGVRAGTVNKPLDVWVNLDVKNLERVDGPDPKD